MTITFKQFISETNPKYLDFKGAKNKPPLKKEMSKEIDKFKRLDHKDPKAYPDDWTADRKYKKQLKSAGKSIPKSEHTEKYEELFGESSNIDVALKNKSEKTGIPVSILRRVFNKGSAAWRTGHRPGVAQAQWAMARVNSFIVGGPARKADKEIWDDYKALKEEWNDSGASDAEGRWSKYRDGKISVSAMAKWLYSSRVHKSLKADKLKSAYGAIAQQENTSKLISGKQADELRVELKRQFS
jgi:hypothetical protein